MNKKQLQIKEPFNEQYTLISESEFAGINVNMNSKVQIRWDFTVLQISEQEAEVKLILLDHALIESNNPLIKEVADFTKAFSRMLNELRLKIDQQGKIIEVLNMDVILSKWKQTKTEMEKIANNNDDIKKAINLHDSLFQDKNKLTLAIQASEFFMLHFNYIYGNDLPFDKKNISKPNFFNSANVQWSCFVNTSIDLPTNSDSISVSLNMEPFMPLGTGFYSRAYSQFANQIDITKLNTRLKESGTYKINPQTGKLLEAFLYREEVANEKQLFTKIKYTLMSEAVYKEFIKDKSSSEIIGTSEIAPKRKISFLADDENLKVKSKYLAFNKYDTQVNVYKYQAVNSDLVDLLKNEEEITILEPQRGGWCKVRTPKGAEGYIHENQIKNVT